MKAADYFAFLWDMAGNDFRLNVCRLCGMGEIFYDFKWTSLDEAQQKRARNTMNSLLNMHKNNMDVEE